LWEGGGGGGLGGGGRRGGLGAENSLKAAGDISFGEWDGDVSGAGVEE